MSNYSFWALGESHITVSGGEQLDGVTQGDGSHLVGHTITLNSNSWEEIDVRDSGSDSNFDDNDGNQRLRGTQTFDGVSYSNNTGIEAEFEIVLQDSNTGETYRVLAVNFNNSSPSYGTIEGLAFVGEFPPIGVALNVISATEGPSGGGSVEHGEIAAPPCFTPGTGILTPTGERRVEELHVGDLVETLHHGAQPVRWIGVCHVTPDRLRQHAAFRPIRIRKDAFGTGCPKRDMLVSPQHRILLRGWQSELMLGENEILSAARHLVNDRSVLVDFALAEVTYLHLQFDAHEIVFSDGLATESFNPGPAAVAAIPDASREELQSLFPHVDLGREIALPLAARQARHWEAKLLAHSLVA